AASLRGKYPTWWTVAVPFPLWRAAMTATAFLSTGVSGSRRSQTTQAWREPGWLIIARMFCRAPKVTPATLAYRCPLELIGAAIAIALTSRVSGPSRPLTWSGAVTVVSVQGARTRVSIAVGGIWWSLGQERVRAGKVSLAHVGVMGALRIPDPGDRRRRGQQKSPGPPEGEPGLGSEQRIFPVIHRLVDPSLNILHGG